MAWTSKQKQLAVRACASAGISDAQRVDVLLRNFRNAHHAGKITSTAPKLTSRDFEAFMALVERFGGGRILHFKASYWQSAANDHLKRMRHRAARVAAILEAAGRLEADGQGLAGWIFHRVSAGAARSLEELEYHGLLALILGLEAYAQQNKVALEPNETEAISR